MLDIPKLSSSPRLSTQHVVWFNRYFHDLLWKRKFRLFYPTLTSRNLNTSHADNKSLINSLFLLNFNLESCLQHFYVKLESEFGRLKMSSGQTNEMKPIIRSRYTLIMKIIKFGSRLGEYYSGYRNLIISKSFLLSDSDCLLSYT